MSEPDVNNEVKKLSLALDIVTLRELRQAADLATAQAEVQRLTAELARLADAVLTIPGEPATEGGAVDVAIRIITETQSRYASGGAWAQVERLTAELAQERVKVEVLLNGDKALAPRIWLNEEVSRLKAERDQARAELAEADRIIRAKDAEVSEMYGIIDQVRAELERARRERDDAMMWVPHETQDKLRSWWRDGRNA
jgi:hypothetical protein